MSHLFQLRLVNDPFGDPGLLLDLNFGRRALLFDLGDLSALSPREVLRVTDVFVSHRHMDHFAGFDRLLRLGLNRPRTLRLVGPEGLVAGVRAKLDAYSWNLLGEGSADFRLLVAEFVDDRLGPWTRLAARDAFRPGDGSPAGLAPGLVHSEPDFEVQAAILDHGLPCLAFALQERLRVNVDPASLARLGLVPGPWLTAAKSALRRGDPDDTLTETGQGRSFPLGELRDRLFRIAPGQRVAYVTDAAFTEENAARIVALARDADQLMIEAAFLHADADQAAARRHLTAHQAGTLAGAAGAKRLTVFHHSPRYVGQGDLLAAEAQAAFTAAGAGTAPRTG
jgi:ribonuclease Z